MNKFFQKFKNYGFWVALSGAVIVFLNALGKAFGFSIENEVVEDCILSFASVLVVLGIVTSGSKNESNKNDDDENKDDENLNEDDK